MSNTSPSGYVVADKSGLIHGIGDSASSAWADAESTLGHAGIAILSDDDDTSEELGSWMRRSDLVAWPATAALIQDVETRGGAIAWTNIGRVACTVDEECSDD